MANSKVYCVAEIKYAQIIGTRGPRDQYTIHRVGGGSLDGLMKILEGQKIKSHIVNIRKH
jgi:hypothetical protein